MSTELNSFRWTSVDLALLVLRIDICRILVVMVVAFSSHIAAGEGPGTPRR